jgi:hypothetical protein
MNELKNNYTTIIPLRLIGDAVREDKSAAV